MIVYVVMGMRGEYDDHTEWCVCWRADEAAAEEMRAALQAEADAYAKWRRDELDGWPNFEAEAARKRTMLDPKFAWDYTGVRYVVVPVPEDPREGHPPAEDPPPWDRP